jgi:hypothetical protein
MPYLLNGLRIHHEVIERQERTAGGMRQAKARNMAWLVHICPSG